MAIEGASQSPIFGYGEPQAVVGPKCDAAPSAPRASYGCCCTRTAIRGPSSFIAFFLAVLWQTRRARGTSGLWLHAIPLIALAQIVVYGWLPTELQVVMVAGALAYRRCWRPGRQADAEISRSAGASLDAAPEPEIPGRPQRRWMRRRNTGAKSRCTLAGTQP